VTNSGQNRAPTKDKLKKIGGPASLATLSAHLGLSAAAISRVLNGVPAAQSIPKATQERIFAAAKQFNYRPNVLARSLRRGHSMNIGVLVPEVSEGYATLVLSGLEQGLLQAGYCYFLLSHHHRAELITSSQRMLAERSVDGMVAIDTVLSEASHLPTVTVSCPVEQKGVTNIVLNHKRAAELAIEHLVGLGHRSIAVIKGQEFSSDTGPRWQAIRQAASKAGIKLDAKLVAQLEGDAPTHEPGYFATQWLLASNTPFTALFAFNDVSAIGAVRALREAGLRVPQDVSVVGFDDVQSAAFQNPALTTVRQPLRTMGMLAAESLVRQIKSPPDTVEVKRLVVDPELVVRESTCAPPEPKRR
jgi:LacI family transcriptional regulator